MLLVLEHGRDFVRAGAEGRAHVPGFFGREGVGELFAPAEGVEFFARDVVGLGEGDVGDGLEEVELAGDGVFGGEGLGGGLGGIGGEGGDGRGVVGGGVVCFEDHARAGEFPGVFGVEGLAEGVFFVGYGKGLEEFGCFAGAGFAVDGGGDLLASW